MQPRQHTTHLSYPQSVMSVFSLIVFPQRHFFIFISRYTSARALISLAPVFSIANGASKKPIYYAILRFRTSNCATNASDMKTLDKELRRGFRDLRENIVSIPPPLPTGCRISRLWVLPENNVRRERLVGTDEVLIYALNPRL